VASQIIEVIGDYLPFRSVRGFKAVAQCPFHDDATDPGTLIVELDKEMFHCDVCGARGDAVGFIAKYEHIGRDEAQRMCDARSLSR
jgi:DNA primase